MNKNMMPYYLSRLALSIAFGGLFFVSGSSWWAAALFGALALAFFLWAPFSGRYAVHPEFGATALRRDERTQIINDRAARNAFIVSMLAVGAISIYFGSSGLTSIPLGMMKVVLIAGILVYFLSDFWMRKTVP